MEYNVFLTETIKEYLNNHPDLTKEDIIVRTKNGKIEVISKAELIKDMPNYQKVKEQYSSIDLQLLEELVKAGDDRYCYCLKSIGQSQKYVSWLLNKPYTDFNILEANGEFELLERLERRSGENANNLINANMKLKNDFDYKLGNCNKNDVLKKEYLSANLQLLRCQRDVFHKEYKLGDKIKNEIKKFIILAKSNNKNHSEQFQFYSKKEWVLSFLKKFISIENVNFKKTIDDKKEQDVLNNALEIYEKKLQYRRQQFKKLSKIIEILEQVIDDAGEQTVLGNSKKPTLKKGMQTPESYKKTKAGRTFRSMKQK